ncbi:MAG: zf-HC2 domain-containing protein [Verrucomicrobiales bacterium]|nr:zf-HC2 domain-containing protein [Verrucomicrobiales bacterium]MCP5526241.1 zf-HC2 domain-containing protein [Verrucomicrobiales bacterium]
MKCQELLALLNDYIDGTVDPALCEEFERHMGGCAACQVVVDNIRKTIRVYCEGREMELPVGFRTRLHDSLRARWKETHPESRS